jgi:hypothetical protein
MRKKTILYVCVIAFLLAGCGAKNAAGDDSTNSAASAGDHHLSNALNLVLGSDETPSVFSSYHMDVTLNSPTASADEKSVVNEVTQIAADVAGQDVHIVQTDPGATASKEGFIIGDKEYKIVDGAPQEMMGQIAVSWAMWPLKVTMAYAYPVYFAEKTGTEQIADRNADVYAFDTNKASAAASNSAMSSMGLGDLTQGKGTVWIDQETGAMLKLDMTYTAKVYDSNQAEIGTGDGSIQIELSQIGQTTVVSPVQ